MPRYFFHTEDGRCVPDEEGSDLPNQGVARIEAVKVLAELLHENADTFWATGAYRVTVSNGDGLTLFTVDVRGADAPESKGRPRW
jgi:hypothetical protein